MEKVDRDIVIVLNLGGKFNQQLTRQIRQLGVYSELHSSAMTVEKVKELQPKGIILSGDARIDELDQDLFELNIPILGVGSGMHVLVEQFGGKIQQKKNDTDEVVSLSPKKNATLFSNVQMEQQVLINGQYEIEQLPSVFVTEATSVDGAVVAIRHNERSVYGIAFRPEAAESTYGEEILKNFLFTVCTCAGDWSAEKFVTLEVEKIRQEVGDRHVLCALSGGVDSSVVALLMQKAIGDQLTCMFIDHGLLRKGEAESVMDTFSDKFKVNLIKIDAKERFLNKLKGVSDPEEKRKVIGNEFIYVFDEEANKLKEMDFLAQGTLYTDIIESGTDSSEKIKSHHNVGGLPEDMRFTLIEPLKTLFKDEVRQVGLALGLPEEIVWRQPFPGPGLGIRVLGEITEKKLYIVRESDAILREEIQKAGLEREIWQYFTALPNMRSVGVTDGKRTYDYTVGIRAVTSVDGTVSEWARIPWEVLDKISERIVAEVDYVNRVVYDITSKPPATIEWE